MGWQRLRPQCRHQTGRGRPPLIVAPPALPLASLPPLDPIERKRFDYSEIEAATASAEQTGRALDRLLAGRRCGHATAL